MTADPQARRRPTRLRLLALGIAVVIAVGGAFYLGRDPIDEGPAPLPVRTEPLLPDLSMAPISAPTGALDGTRRFLKFGVTITNLGNGPFLVSAIRSNVVLPSWFVRQRVPEAGGGFTQRETDATLVFGGDGHDHWHIREVEAHRLEMPDGTVLGEVVKNGFCFFDTDRVRLDLPGVPARPTYSARGCGDRLSTKSEMGLSVGWGDEYAWHLFEQHIEITNVPDGPYRIRAIADPYGWFEELNETNNEVWSDIEIFTEPSGVPGVRVLGTSSGEPAESDTTGGPSAP